MEPTYLTLAELDQLEFAIIVAQSANHSQLADQLRAIGNAHSEPARCADRLILARGPLRCAWLRGHPGMHTGTVDNEALTLNWGRNNE